jgi:Asp/Glu/hydantoin racemase
MTRILVINPNTSATVSDVIRRGLAAMAMDGTQITVINAPFGAEAIETPAEACIAGHAVLAALAERREGYDAVVIGAFGDPGLDAVASVMTVPVVGTGTAAILEASRDGQAFAIVTMGAGLKSAIEAQVARCGVLTQLTSIQFIEASVLDVAGNQQRFVEAIRGHVRGSANAAAKAVVLGGAPFTGMGALLTRELGMPVAAGLEPALRRVCDLAERPGTGTPPHYSKPTKRFVGLSDGLIALLKGASNHTQKKS